jgi:uncharacterized protein (TIGR03435 family)
MMVGFAWDVRDHQISGGPKWFGSDLFGIEARPDSAVSMSSSPEDMERLRLMVQSLLEDRFNLALHRESRMEQVYELVVVKSGSKLKETAGPDKDGKVGIFGRGRGDLTGIRFASAYRSLTQTSFASLH